MQTIAPLAQELQLQPLVHPDVHEVACGLPSRCKDPDSSGKEKHMNMNKFWGLSLYWGSGKSLFMCSLASFLMGEKSTYTKSPENPRRSRENFCFCVFVLRSVFAPNFQTDLHAPPLQFYTVLVLKCKASSVLFAPEVYKSQSSPTKIRRFDLRKRRSSTEAGAFR